MPREVGYPSRYVSVKNCVRTLLAKMMINVPDDILARLQQETLQLVFEAVRRLGLLRAVGEPIVNSKAVRKLVVVRTPM